jgi:phosphoribosylanthranilate isomerase
VVRVKICGLKSREDLQASVDSGADAVGVVVYSPRSPRNLSLEEAGRILSAVPPFVSSVLVSATTSPDAIVRATERLNPSAVQLHGITQPSAVKHVASTLKSQVIGVLAWNPSQKEEELKEKAKKLAEVASAVLFDSTTAEGYGGTGCPVSWKVARMVGEAVRPKPFILAGGLTAGNVQEAIAAVQPYAVDVSSGVESSPGVKDYSQIQAFIRKAKTAGVETG